MVVVFLVRLFYPHIGGVEKHVLELSKRLLKNGFKIYVITEKYDRNLQDEEMFEGIRIMRITIPKDEKLKKFYIWNWMVSNRNVVRNASIVHVHDVFYWYLPIKMIYPFRRVFMTFHGYEGDRLPTIKDFFMHKTAELLSSGNICVGDYLKKWYGTKPTYITYGAVNMPLKQKKQKNIKSAIFVGRLEKETNIMGYLKALKVLKDQNINISLDVIGDGSLRNKAEKFAFKNKLNVTFNGTISNVQRSIQSHEFVFSSRFLSTLDAFSMKKFVFVLYNNEILKDCFEMSPFRNAVSINGNYKELIRSVKYYLNNKTVREEKALMGYEWVKGQTWVDLARVYSALWKKNE